MSIGDLTVANAILLDDRIAKPVKQIFETIKPLIGTSNSSNTVISILIQSKTKLIVLTKESKNCQKKLKLS
jgi:hypothetical protein